ncbi:tRNA lysidine(34) synthetase TilS [Carnobacterium sp. TMP28]|uniref:tRNA lysidine(34) synthetase TilS n=1 Tax=Carnobacterium sp. TMP28 TaxID=3397060 RepID=UPI0039E18C31
MKNDEPLNSRELNLVYEVKWEMELSFDFTEKCRQHLLWTPSDRLLIAVSGGVDSMALLDLIQSLPDTLRPWYGVVHVNHELRTASMEEERFLKEQCRSKEIPYFSRHWDSKKHPKTGIELAARNFRYAFFKETMQVTGATHLLTAHHADDQLETILMRLVRGGQLKGMTGIQVQRPFGTGLLVRPLLHFSKEQIYTYSKTRQLDYYEDETNVDLLYTRNRYRQKITPLLKLENKQVLTHFKDFSADLSDVLFLANQVIQKKSEQILLQSKPNFYELDKKALLSCEPEVQRQVLKHILIEKVYHACPVETLRKQVEELVGLMTRTKSNAQLDLPGGWKARREYQHVYLEKNKLSHSVLLQKEEKLLLGQWVSITNGARIGLFKVEAHATSPFEKDEHIWIEPSEVILPLLIRHRKSGDRMTLKGMDRGHKKVKTILIDQKISLKAREEMLILTDSLDEIIWLLKYKESRLSIQRETDKIQYILVYQK